MTTPNSTPSDTPGGEGKPSVAPPEKHGFRQTLALTLGTAFGLGKLPACPGTWGSLFPLALFLTAHYLSVPWRTNLAGLVALILIYSWATIAFGERLHAHFGRKDPKEVVSDEVAGQSVALVAAIDLPTALAAFVAFRIFDVLKPGPIKRLEKLPGGHGVLADDLAAGIAGALCILLLRLVLFLITDSS